MNQIEKTQVIINYIEDHLHDESLQLDTIANDFHYSTFHLHRMFSGVVGMPIHTYIMRRRLNEAGKQLVQSTTSILEIALSSGYETQRSFSKEFKKLFHCSPDSYRKKKEYLPLQLVFDRKKQELMNIQKPISVTKQTCPSIKLVGYQVSTVKGFFVIGRAFRKLHKHKQEIQNRSDLKNLIGLNDYTNFEQGPHTPNFSFFAGAEVSTLTDIPKHMATLELPTSTYVVFTFKGKNEDSIEPIVSYVYHTWFCESTCVFNEANIYDFVKYGEDVDDKGISTIEYWVPIKA